MFKICTSCTPRYQKPIGSTRRKCPTCGAKDAFVFRRPTEKEVQAEMDRKAKIEATIQSLLSELQ